MNNKELEPLEKFLTENYPNGNKDLEMMWKCGITFIGNVVFIESDIK